MLGRAESIGCPYCLSSVMIGVDRLCCASMGEAVATVLQRIEAACAHLTVGFGGFAAGLQMIAETDEAKDRSGVDNFPQYIQ
jgi:hypothetical protein